MTRLLFLIGLTASFSGAVSSAEDASWIKHTIHSGQRAMMAVASDSTGDSLPDVITDTAEKTQLFIAPDWTEVILDDHAGVQTYIHSECFDVDGDGDTDYIGARYNPGLIVWLENPGEARSQRWRKRVISDSVHGIHGLLTGDADGDGTTDLLATSVQPTPPHPESLVWFSVPKQPHADSSWKPNVFADGDAPGLTHYLGVGNVDGDIDFVASRGHGVGVVWFQAPSWKRHGIDATIREPHCLAVIDMDQDGDVDAATCAFG